MSKTRSWLLALAALLFANNAWALPQTTPRTAWVARYTGTGTDGAARAQAVDDQGNVFVTGTSAGQYATVKYDRDGRRVWAQRYGRYANPTAIALDGAGNVLVTGYSLESATGYDYATIKYDAQGNELWARRYSGPSNPFTSNGDRASALALDALGNVYVTGNSPGASGGAQYATLKYDPFGNLVWEQRAAVGSGATALVLDANNNVLVTGGGGTIKYDNNGAALWGSGGGAVLAVDPAGNVVVVGGGPVYATTKLGPDGTLRWYRTYAAAPLSARNVPRAVALDGSGNVFVTGDSEGSAADFLTLKYNPDGDQLWAQRYTTPPPSPTTVGYEYPTALALDAEGNAYVTGYGYVGGSSADYDFITVKYGPGGDERWVRRYSGPGFGRDQASAVTVDRAGGVYVTGSRDGLAYVTLKYDADGNRLWNANYAGPGPNLDEATALATDAAGNVYVTGTSTGDGTYTDITTLKYDKDGNLLWVARYDGPFSLRDRPSALALDAAGNVYVTGNSESNSIDSTYVALKYDADGNQRWVARYNTPSFDQATALGVDAQGNVYVTGQSYSRSYPRQPSTHAYATVKYDADGNEVWVRRYNEDTLSRATALVLDAAGNVYVTGRANSGSLAGDFRYATVKYAPNGDELWVRHYNGPGVRYSRAVALALDGAGNVYVTGNSVGLSNSDDIATVKYDADGNELWVARYNGPTSRDDGASALALDAFGNVTVTGESRFSNTLVYLTTIQYDASGNQRWVARSAGGTGKSVAADARGNVFVAGSLYGGGVPGTGSDYATIGYDAFGNERWVARFNGQGGLYDNNDAAQALALDPFGNVLVTGYSSGTPDTYRDYLTIKYVPRARPPLIKNPTGVN